VTVLGTVVRVQVQRSRLKPGERGQRRYDPAPLLEVAALDVGPRGVVGQGPDGPVADVHHADVPDSRNVKLVNGLSLLPRAHYARLRTRFGPHLVDGIAGESLLVETDGPWSPDALEGELLLETADGGLLPLSGGRPAPPCVEFARFCLGDDSLAAGDPRVREALADLADGARGFYVQPGGSGQVRAGALLRRA
jgi:hypothetical protein